MKTEEIKVIGVYLYLMDDPDDDEGFTVDPDKR